MLGRMSGDTLQVVFDTVAIAVLAWFWIFRVRPILTGLRAEPLALRLGLLATVIAIVGLVLHLVAVAVGADGFLANLVRVLGGLVWLVIVGIGYPRYYFLRHATGSRPPGQ